MEEINFAQLGLSAFMFPKSRQAARIIVNDYKRPIRGMIPQSEFSGVGAGFRFPLVVEEIDYSLLTASSMFDPGLELEEFKHAFTNNIVHCKDWCLFAMEKPLFREHKINDQITGLKFI